MVEAIATLAILIASEVMLWTGCLGLLVWAFTHDANPLVSPAQAAALAIGGAVVKHCALNLAGRIKNRRCG